MLANVAVAVICSLAISVAPLDPVERAQEELQGSWRIVERTRTGSKEAPFEFENVVYAFDKDVLTITAMRRVTYRIELHPDKDPKWIDLIHENGDGEVFRFPGIYKIEGDALTICLAQPKRARPTQFVSEGKKNQTDLTVFKREKSD